jgi:hypothetical protein
MPAAHAVLNVEALLAADRAHDLAAGAVWTLVFDHHFDLHRLRKNCAVS